VEEWGVGEEVSGVSLKGRESGGDLDGSGKSWAGGEVPRKGFLGGLFTLS
jgi:hypothetical protein